MAERPNILIIMADQLAPHFVGAYGHPIAKTPHMDALAARGMRFDGAYCNSPLCAPSRASFMSGQLPSQIGAYDNASEFPASVPTFAHALGAAGYRTCLSGKMHFVGPDQMHGFMERLTTDIYPADFAWTPKWEANEARIDKWYHNMEVVRESGVAQATYQIDYDDETAFHGCRWLFDYARDKAAGRNEPFAMVAGFIHPHDPYVARPEWWDLYKDDDIGLPDFVPEEPDPFSARLMDGIEASRAPLTDEEIIRARRAYLANVSYFDSKVGALVRTLDEIGEADNTVVIVTSDHGDMLGERGLWFKMNFFEHSARVPLIMAGPGVATGRHPNACSLVDVFPTLVDIAGGDGGAFPLDGRSLWPVATGGTDSSDGAIGEYCAEMAGHPVFMIRRGPFKYVHCDTDPPQMYDVAADPSERVNLCGDPAFADVEAAFVAEVQDRWDSAALRDDVIRTQKLRHALHAAVEAGASQPWDYTPPVDASQQYVRNTSDWTEAAVRFRFPRRPTG